MTSCWRLALLLLPVPFACWWHCMLCFLLFAAAAVLPIYHGHLGSTSRQRQLIHTLLHTLSMPFRLGSLFLLFAFHSFCRIIIILQRQQQCLLLSLCDAAAAVDAVFAWRDASRIFCFLPFSVLSPSRPALSNAIVWILVLFIFPSLCMFLLLLVHSFTPLVCAKM